MMKPETVDYIRSMEVRPFGPPVAQAWYQVGLVFHLIDELKVRSFIELGMFCGGLSDLLIRRTETMADMAFMGFEIDGAVLERHCPRVRAHPSAVIADVFDASTVVRVLEFINARPGVAFVYCDDGNKQKEMRTYAPILRVGDAMMAHDYPGETTPESLDDFARKFPYMAEQNPPLYRDMGVSLWRRTA